MPGGESQFSQQRTDQQEHQSGRQRATAVAKQNTQSALLVSGTRRKIVVNRVSEIVAAAAVLGRPVNGSRVAMAADVRFLRRNLLCIPRPDRGRAREKEAGSSELNSCASRLRFISILASIGAASGECWIAVMSGTLTNHSRLLNASRAPCYSEHFVSQRSRKHNQTRTLAKYTTRRASAQPL